MIAIGLYITGAVRAGKMQVSIPEVAIPIVSELPFLDRLTDSTPTPEPTYPDKLWKMAAYTMPCSWPRARRKTVRESRKWEGACVNSPYFSG